MVLGSIMLIDITDAPRALYSISLRVIIPIVLFTAAFVIVALIFAIRAHRRQPTTGREGLIGEKGTALSDIAPHGMVLVHGEYWKAIAATPITRNTPIVVIAIERMTVTVEPLQS